MKTTSLVCRLLLGLIFTVFGLNGFLHFIPMGEMPSGNASQFLGVLVASHYWSVVAFFQLVCGVLLLVNRYVPLALAILGPIIVNIILFHSLMAPGGLPLALFTTALWVVVILRVRSAFAPLFQQHAQL